MQNEILIIGCGDVGKQVLALLNPSLNSISIASHRARSQVELSNLGFNVVMANLDTKQNLEQLPTTGAHIFYFAPPPGTSPIDNRMLNFVASLDVDHPPKRIIYISTTGVYGDCSDHWIKENAPLKPNNDRSKRRLHAESQIQAFCAKSYCEYVLLRVAGIYCLEKLPIERLKNGLQVLHPDIAPSSNRIHAKDLARCCVKAMFEGPANEIFNIADGHPSSISDYFIKVAEIFSLPKPILLNWTEAEATLTPAMLSYLHESKKISIDKLTNSLDFQPDYPTLANGLTACYQLHCNKAAMNATNK